MKKSMVLAGASAVGVGMVAFGAAPGAVAADVTVPCDTVDDHNVTSGTLYDNWFMDCVPQFGAGKAEFTVTSTYTLPGDFLPLDDPGVTSTYSGDAAAAADYFGVSGMPAGWLNLMMAPPGGDPLEYVGNPIVPISGVGPALASDLPAACETDSNNYSHIYRVDYPETSWQFEQSAGGFEWSVTVTHPATTVFLALSLDTPTLDNEPFDDSAMCLTDGTTTTFGLYNQMPETLLVMTWPFWFEDNSTAISPLLLSESGPDPDLGDFPLARSSPAGGGSGPGLADTGAEVSPLLLSAGAIALLGGAALLAITRARKGRRDSA